MSSPTDAYSVSPVYEVQYEDGSALSRRELIDKRVYFIEPATCCIFLDAFQGNSVILSVALESVVPRQQGCNNRNLENKVNFWQNSPKIAYK